MRVFVTGATGFVGSAVVQDLIAAGHKVLGLARSDAGAAVARRRRGRGAPRRSRGPRQPAQRRGVIGRRDPHRLHPRLLKIPGGLRGGQAGHRGARRRARRLRPSPGRHLRDRDAGAGPPRDRGPFRSQPPEPPRASEFAAEAVAARGVRVSVVRLPQVHNTENRPRYPPRSPSPARRASSAYVGDGLNRWPAVHLLDAAPVYRLALEKGTTPGQVSRGRRGGRSGPRDRRRHRPGLEDPGRLHVPRGGRRPLRLARVLRRDGHAGVERANAGAAGMAAEAARPDRRSRPPALFRNLKSARPCGAFAPRLQRTAAVSHATNRTPAAPPGKRTGRGGLRPRPSFARPFPSPAPRW